MIYLDNDYKIDCENKIKYDLLTELPVDEFKTKIKACKNIEKVYSVYADGDARPVFLIKTNGSLGISFLSEDCFVKEISKNMYKVVLN